jgi:hypothetical protein
VTGIAGSASAVCVVPFGVRGLVAGAEKGAWAPVGRTGSETEVNNGAGAGRRTGDGEGEAGAEDSQGLVVRGDGASRMEDDGVSKAGVGCVVL